jgi:UDP-N-acetyl-D-glucosamine dehydrogenase
MGYVGLPLAVAFAQEGFDVIGIDIHAEKVKTLNEGISYVEHIADKTLKPLAENGKLVARKDYYALANADTISFCVPTLSLPGWRRLRCDCDRACSI